jgi:hypothetical protein
MLKEIEKILNQKMTRAQFLKSLGLGLLTIIGLPAIIHILSPKAHPQTAQVSGNGFGSGTYGA